MVLSIYALVLRIYKGGNFFIRENHFTKGNRDWFGENNITDMLAMALFPASGLVKGSKAGRAFGKGGGKREIYRPS